MPDPRSLVLAAVLLAAPMAGCLGGGGEDAAPASATTNGSADADTDAAAREETSGQANRTPLAFDGAPTLETIWANGTYQPQENCYAGGCLTGDALREVPLDDALPEDQPARVTATMTYDEGPTVFGSPVNMGLSAQDASIYAFEQTEEDPGETFTFSVLAGSGSVALQLFYQWPTGAEPEVSYTLEVTVEADPLVVPPGATAAVDLAPGDTVTASAAGEGPTAVELRGPDDRPVDRATGESGEASVSVPEDGDAGEHVLVVPQASAPVRLASQGEASSMRPLPIAVEASEPRDATPGQTLAFEEDVDPAPIAVAAYTTTTTPVGVSASEGSVTVEAPGGTVVDGDLGCNLCLTLDYFETAWSDTGVDALDAGTYTVTYEPGAEAGWQVGLLTAIYER